MLSFKEFITEAAPLPGDDEEVEATVIQNGKMTKISTKRDNVEDWENKPVIRNRHTGSRIQDGEYPEDRGSAGERGRVFKRVPIFRA